MNPYRWIKSQLDRAAKAVKEIDDNYWRGCEIKSPSFKEIEQRNAKELERLGNAARLERERLKNQEGHGDTPPGKADDSASSNEAYAGSGCSFVAYGLLAFGILTQVVRCDSNSPPTEREKQEAGTRAILREYGRPGQSEAEIDREAKSVVDEWEKVSK